MSSSSTSAGTSAPSGIRSDGDSPYAEGESWKTGSSAKQERLEAYVEWLLTPAGDRNPRTKREFAEQWGVSYETLRKDAREPYLQRELAVRARAVARVEDLPKIIGNMIRIATGDPGPGINGAATPPPGAQVQAARLLLEWWAKTEPIRESDQQVSDMSDAELVEAALRLLKLADDEPDTT